MVESPSDCSSVLQTLSSSPSRSKPRKRKHTHTKAHVPFHVKHPSQSQQGSKPAVKALRRGPACVSWAMRSCKASKLWRMASSKPSEASQKNKKHVANLFRSPSSDVRSLHVRVGHTLDYLMFCLLTHMHRIMQLKICRYVRSMFDPYLCQNFSQIQCQQKH